MFTHRLFRLYPSHALKYSALGLGAGSVDDFRFATFHLHYMCLYVFVVGECRKLRGDFYFILFILCIVHNTILC